jgi:hypothetical protein
LWCREFFELMNELFATGRVIDLILLLVVLEGLGLALLRRVTARGPLLRDILPTLISGGLLLVALRAAMADASWRLIAVPLLGALIAHLVDLSRRWRQHALALDKIDDDVDTLPRP